MLGRYRLSGFRNLCAVDVEWHPTCSIVYGQNASGKTSLLEGVHVLARGRSFRTTGLDRLVTVGAKGFTAYGEVQRGDQRVRVGVAREAGTTRARIDGRDATGLSELAWQLPVQVVNTESQRLLQDGPAGRRSFLNWTVFHVEHGYHAAWRRADRGLRQRNAALRAGQVRLARSLEGEFVAAAERVDRMRAAVVARLAPAVREQLQGWLPGVEVEIRYRRGWARDRALADVLTGQRDSELRQGFTLAGPQRADLRITVGGRDAVDVLSRGQQKLVVIALLLGQSALFYASSGTPPIALVDDLPAELDADARRLVLDGLLDGTRQCLLTAIDPDALPVAEARWFHVEQGRVSKVL